MRPDQFSDPGQDRDAQMPGRSVERLATIRRKPIPNGQQRAAAREVRSDEIRPPSQGDTIDAEVTSPPNEKTSNGSRKPSSILVQTDSHPSRVKSLRFSDLTPEAARTIPHTMRRQPMYAHRGQLANATASSARVGSTGAQHHILGQDHNGSHTSAKSRHSPEVYEARRALVSRMQEMGFERESTLRAAKAASWDPVLCAEYLLTGVPQEPRLDPSSSANNASGQVFSVATSEAPTDRSDQPYFLKQTGKRSLVTGASPVREISHDSGHAIALKRDDYNPILQGYTTDLAQPLEIDTTGFVPSEVKPVNDEIASDIAGSSTLSAQERNETSGQPASELKPLFDRQPAGFSDADFVKIGDALHLDGQDAWALRPRIYTVMKMINGIDEMQRFVEAELFDISLPFAKNELPIDLSAEQHARFLAQQTAVLTKAARSEGGLESTHANFGESADNHLISLGELGEGGHGAVDRVKSRLSGKIYARKRLDREKSIEKGNKAVRYFQNEIAVLKRLKHHHLVRYSGSYTDPQYIGIIMAPVADCNLDKFLGQASGEANRDTIMEAFGCLCAALIYLQEQDIRHKDIKPANILIKGGKIYMTDFGMARDWTAKGISTTTGENLTPISKLYAAPEVLAWAPRGSSSDIWSLGCVFLDMMTALKGETQESMRNFFRSNGQCGLEPCTNREAYLLWVKNITTTENNEPLDWIKDMLLVKRDARITARQLMSRIHSCEAAKAFYGACCAEDKDEEMQAAIKEMAEEDSSAEEGSDVEVSVKKAPDRATLERNLCTAAQKADARTLRRWLRKAQRLGPGRLRTQAIHHAATRPNTEIVKILIDSGCDLQFKLNGRTPLLTAVATSSADVVELFAQTKVAINEPELGSHLRSALHLAALRSSCTIVEILLRAGAAVDATDKGLITPLLLSCHRRDCASVTVLLAHGANISTTDLDGWSAIQVVALNGSDLVTKILLDAGADVEQHFDGITKENAEPTFTPLNHAVARGHPAVVRLLLERGARPTMQTKVHGRVNATPLHTAAATGPMEILDMLLAAKPELEIRDAFGLTPLHCAAAASRTEAVDHLLAAGANVDAKSESGATAFAHALRHKQYDMAQHLLGKGADMMLQDRRNKATILHHAVAEEDTDSVRFLVANSANIGVRDGRECTPLSLAICQSNLEIVRVLLEHGTNKEALRSPKTYYLHLAALYADADVVKFLVEQGLGVESKDLNSMTPLLLAAAEGRQENVKYLRELGASIEATDEGGRAALHFAAASGDLELVSMLLSWGVDPMPIARDSYTPMILARARHHDEVAGLLVKKLADANRVLYDPAVPGVAVFLTREDVLNGWYHVLDYDDMLDGHPAIVAPHRQLPRLRRQQLAQSLRIDLPQLVPFNQYRPYPGL